MKPPERARYGDDVGVGVRDRDARHVELQRAPGGRLDLARVGVRLPDGADGDRVRRARREVQRDRGLQGSRRVVRIEPVLPAHARHGRERPAGARVDPEDRVVVERQRAEGVDPVRGGRLRREGEPDDLRGLHLAARREEELAVAGKRGAAGGGDHGPRVHGGDRIRQRGGFDQDGCGAGSRRGQRRLVGPQGEREGSQGGQGRAGECPDRVTGINRLLLYGFLDAYSGISGVEVSPAPPIPRQGRLPVKSRKLPTFLRVRAIR